MFVVQVKMGRLTDLVLVILYSTSQEGRLADTSRHVRL